MRTGLVWFCPLTIGTGDTLHMSQHEKSPLGLPKKRTEFEFTVRNVSASVPYYTQLKTQMHKRTNTQTHTGWFSNFKLYEKLPNLEVVTVTKTKHFTLFGSMEYIYNVLIKTLDDVLVKLDRFYNK